LAEVFNYYVWYRVVQDDRDTETALRSMMARLGCRTGVAGRLLKKRGEPLLWMEIYEGVDGPAVFERALRQAEDEYDVAMFIDAARRTECFLAEAYVPLACAASG
jgi:hypothetical protein